MGEKQTADKQTAEKQTAEKQTADKQTAEKPSKINKFKIENSDNIEGFEAIALNFSKMIKRDFNIKRINVENLEHIVDDYIRNAEYASIFIQLYKTKI
jgi:hypothetical protein